MLHTEFFCNVFLLWFFIDLFFDPCSMTYLEVFIDIFWYTLIILDWNIAVLSLSVIECKSIIMK